jgi:hypothetical protein
MAKQIETRPAFRPRLLRARRIEKPPDGRDAIGGKAYTPGMFLNGRLVRGEVDAVHLVADYAAMEPLDLRTHCLENIDRLLRDFPSDSGELSAITPRSFCNGTIWG